MDNWTDFIDSVFRLCSEVERRVTSSDSNALQDFLLRLQTSRTACERILIVASSKDREDGVDAIARLDIVTKLKPLSISIQALIDSVEKQLFSVDCQTYSSRTISEVLVNRTDSVGRPRLLINLTQIEYLRTWRFTWTRISYTLCVSRTTLWRRLKEANYNFQESRFTDITDSELEREIQSIKADFENCGERMVLGSLRSRNIHVARHRVRDIIRRIDPINTALRWKAMNPRYKYNVPGPNALWHIDGLHKLIKWGFVVHGGIDGYSRLIVFLSCASNNRASTVYSCFLQSTRKYGTPSRIRTDYGGENAEIGKHMESVRGTGRGSHIAGSSVYNQRIERLHRDTTRCCLSSFYSVFANMEDEGVIDISNDTDMFCLHYVFLPRINRALEEFRMGWNHHSLSSEGNLTPYQCWISGVISDKFSGYTAVQDIRNSELDSVNYGVDADLQEASQILNDENEGAVIVEEPMCPLNENQLQHIESGIDPLSNSTNFGIDIYLKCVATVAKLIN